MKLADSNVSQKCQQMSLSYVKSVELYHWKVSWAVKWFISKLRTLWNLLIFRVLDESKALIMAFSPSSAQHRGLDNEQGQDALFRGSILGKRRPCGGTGCCQYLLWKLATHPGWSTDSVRSSLLEQSLWFLSVALIVQYQWCRKQLLKNAHLSPSIHEESPEMSSWSAAFLCGINVFLFPFSPFF